VLALRIPLANKIFANLKIQEKIDDVVGIITFLIFAIFCSVADNIVAYQLFF